MLYTQDAQGWTVIPTLPDSKTYYVSSSAGNDANDGSEAKPFSTIKKAYSVLRQKSGDSFLLKKGDVWREPVGDWKIHGLPNAPSGIGAYGTGPRPKVITATEFMSMYTPWENVFFVGIDFEAATRNPTASDFNQNCQDFAGLQVGFSGANMLLEDCRFAYYDDNLVLQASGQYPTTVCENIVVRRCVIVGAWGHNEFGGQGIYSQNVNGLLIEENVFDNNGYEPNSTTVSLYRHAMYLNHIMLSNVVVRGNIVSRSSSFGVQLRTDGVVDGNFFFDNAVHASISGVNGQFTNNVVIGGHNVNRPVIPLKAGIAINSVNSLVENNIFTDKDDPTAHWNVPALSPGVRAWTPAGKKVAIIRNNVVNNWCTYAAGGNDQWDEIDLTNNIFQNCNGGAIQLLGKMTTYNVSGNVYWEKNGAKFANTPNVPDDSTIKNLNYPRDMWVASDFLTRINNQSKDTWDAGITAAALNASFRALFGQLKPQNQVATVSLYDANIGQAIFNPIANSAVIDLEVNKSICFAATMTGAGHLLFEYEGQSHIEVNPPYCFPGDLGPGKGYVGFTPTVGSHTIKITPFDAQNVAGTPVEVTVTAVAQKVTTLKLDYADGTSDAFTPKAGLKEVQAIYFDNSVKALEI